MFPYWIQDDYTPPERSARRIALRSRRSAREAELLRYARSASAATHEQRRPSPASRATSPGRFSLLFGRMARA